MEAKKRKREAAAAVGGPPLVTVTVRWETPEEAANGRRVYCAEERWVSAEICISGGVDSTELGAHVESMAEARGSRKEHILLLYALPEQNRMGFRNGIPEQRGLCRRPSKKYVGAGRTFAMQEDADEVGSGVYWSIFNGGRVALEIDSTSLVQIKRQCSTGKRVRTVAHTIQKTFSSFPGSSSSPSSSSSPLSSPLSSSMVAGGLSAAAAAPSLKISPDPVSTLEIPIEHWNGFGVTVKCSVRGVLLDGRFARAEATQLRLGARVVHRGAYPGTGRARPLAENVSEFIFYPVDRSPPVSPASLPSLTSLPQSPPPSPSGDLGSSGSGSGSSFSPGRPSSSPLSLSQQPPPLVRLKRVIRRDIVVGVDWVVLETAPSPSSSAGHRRHLNVTLATDDAVISCIQFSECDYADATATAAATITSQGEDEGRKKGDTGGVYGGIIPWEATGTWSEQELRPDGPGKAVRMWASEEGETGEAAAVAHVRLFAPPPLPLPAAVHAGKEGEEDAAAASPVDEDDPEFIWRLLSGEENPRATNEDGFQF